MTERKTLGKIECKGVDGDNAHVLVYALGEQVSLVMTTESNGDVEVLLSDLQAQSLREILQRKQGMDVSG